MEQSELLERLLKFDWGDIAKKLTAFVIQYMNYCTGKKYSDWNLPGGYKAQDVAYKAISDVLSGVRTWNPDKDSDFLRYMQFSVCRSIISNLYSKVDTVKNERVGQSEYFNSESSIDFEYYANQYINFGLHFEQHIDNDMFLSKLDKELSGDEIGQLVLLSVVEGNANRHIAEDLGINEGDVTNAKKRIKRAADRLICSLN